MLKITDRLFCGFGGVFGAAGIASFAAASHFGGYYGAIAPILLSNGCVLIALSLSTKTNFIMQLGGILIILGVTLFAGDILLQQMNSSRLFPFAAPLGGIMNILGWLLFFVRAFIPNDHIPKQ